MKFDDFLFTYLGEMGKYQKIQFFLVCLPTIVVSMHALSWTFASVDTPYRCRLPSDLPEKEPYYTTLLNFTKCTNDADANVPISEYGKPGVTCHYDRCTLPDNETCHEHIFDHSKVEYTAVQRWEITCDRSWIKATIQAAYYVGQMAGSTTFGMLGDRIGRKKVFFLAIVIQITCAYLIAIAPYWWLYALARAGTGFSHPGIFVIAVVIGMELVGPKYRKLASVITGLFFALGQIFLGIEAIYFTNYQILHVVIASPALLFLSYWWLVPESARWLVSQKRYKEADEVLQKAASVNGTVLPENWWEQLDDSTTGGGGAPGAPTKKLTGADLFRTPELRKRTLVVFFLWPVISMVYYGMAMKANVLGGDIYVNFIFAAFVEIPALFIVYLLIDRIGRRLILAGGLFIAGACLLVNWLMGDNVQLWMAITQMAFTKGSITGVYAAIYTYSPELFPTVIRNTAMGFCSTIARVGAIAASYISMWIAEQFGKVFMIIPFGCMAVLAAVMTLLFLPETMGKPLPESIEEIEEGDSYRSSHEMQPLSKSTEETA
ncbi:Major facilitator superfamily (MFS) profile domain-containing protein [Caenorhabditis elegans]|uniref:Major facilitator superfamily (MFS) profile domain-containing protein n=1 Tax=Caenorhabditis elegans TaxID=6239 RepID=A0ACB0DPJ4_CAEEL|nr:Major facilitator superfamily (MFS) profile domain-containing protein [Caenorhabditis elegans]CAI9651156.1 Major facilitator superfamily (MFS) profile domain-containing protein [Caenorhabditis elegans]